MPIRIPTSALSIEEIDSRVEELMLEKNRLLKLPTPQFKPLKEYVDDQIIHEISLAMTNSLTSQVKELGYVFREGKTDELERKFFLSLSGWGKDSNFSFRHIPSREFVRKSFFKAINPFVGGGENIVSDFSILIDQVFKQLDYPPVVDWYRNEYLSHRNFINRGNATDQALLELYNQRSLKSNRNISVSSSPIQG